MFNLKQLTYDKMFPHYMVSIDCKVPILYPSRRVVMKIVNGTFNVTEDEMVVLMKDLKLTAQIQCYGLDNINHSYNELNYVQKH